ncbi:MULTISPECIES: hypothetical protein [Microbacterium]|uniref:hypothetical protein n=1 Tax=Microbacterium TaxID=33882 RepID=UPI000D659103|nr:MULTISPECIES: hypothetical protein [Microbacterium]
MTQHVDAIATDAGVHWTKPARGAWAADRNGRALGEVRREAHGFTATRGGRRVGTYRSLGAALDAVDHHHLTSPGRFWTLLLTTVNVGMVAAISLIATAILR